MPMLRVHREFDVEQAGSVVQSGSFIRGAGFLRTGTSAGHRKVRLFLSPGLGDGRRSGTENSSHNEAGGGRDVPGGRGAVRGSGRDFEDLFDDDDIQ
ncbi:COP9 signalosome complex subunit 9 isoform X1 [Scyliorhinus canicula]|uniref:COP9 signalosome complex subunit 9 isoform X1 n=1 Tax=Scyliorhinus canicula TaxID=7830 RepID=UPI0018F60E47|nr:COP9 signalosome complex subunit 9 isoform X1 [Scyliorhinus canicula]